jgi:predicted extracellular nuclease
MKKPVASIKSPGQLTVLAALLAGLTSSAYAQTTTPPANHVVISQIYGTGGNGNAGTTTEAKYRNDFVELFNPTASDVSLAGWSLQYGASGSTGNWSGNFGLSGTIGAGKYFLVRLASQAAVGSDLPAPDLATTGINISGTAGKIALVQSTVVRTGAQPQPDSLVDFVGYGTANGSETATAAAPANNQTAMFRAAAGCTDSDNNRNDFSLDTAAPHNSSSPVNSCGSSTAAKPIIASCPALSVMQGIGGSGQLSATDEDSMVTGAAISSGAVAGITLGAFSAAGSDGQAGSVSLNVASSVAPGSYPVGITFTNNEDQTGTCTASVTVQPASTATLTIMDVQGSGATSAYANQVVTVEGVLTYKFQGTGTGFFIQDQNGDGDPTTSDGIMIYAATTTAAVGDVVRVTGTVFEYKPAGQPFSYTEIKDTTAITRVRAGTPIQPTNVSMPMDLGRVQGMLVQFPSLTINGVNNVGTRGELTLASTRREVPTNHYRPGTPEAIAMETANAIDQIVLDDGLFTVPATIPYIGADSTVRVGDTVSNVTGVVDFGSTGNSNNGYKLQVARVADVSISRTNQRGAPAAVAGNVRVASANVLNFFTTFQNGNTVFGDSGQYCYPSAPTTAKPIPAASENCRGADNMAEFVRQRDKIVNELLTLDADVVGLMEMQNNGNTAVSYLVDQMNAKTGFTTYTAVAMPASAGTDAIRVAMIYKPAVVTPVGAPMSDGDSVNNRAPLAQTFKAVSNGGKFSVIVNHLKSKGGSCPSTGVNSDSGDGQGCHNGTRILQAQRLANYFIPEVKRVAGDPDVLIIGDMNSHGFEDPINLLTTAGMVNELERFVRPNGIAYSYNFDSLSGYLDHALASSTLDTQVSGASEWHNNADEPEVIDYNTDGKPQDLYVNNAYRASDHDPVLVTLNLAGSFADVSNSFTVSRGGYTVNRTTGQYNGTVTITNSGSAAISGPVNVELTGLPAGVTLINKSGMHNGVPYITMSSAAMAPGATIAMPLQFSNPSKVPLSYSTIIYSGSF